MGDVAAQWPLFKNGDRWTRMGQCVDYDRGFEYIVIEWANGFDRLEDCVYSIQRLALRGVSGQRSVVGQVLCIARCSEDHRPRIEKTPLQTVGMFESQKMETEPAA